MSKIAVDSGPAMALTGSNLDVLWYRDMVLGIYRWPTPEKVGL